MRAVSFAVCSHGQEDKELSGVSSYKGTIPVLVPPHDLLISQSPLPDTITLGIRGFNT